MSPVDPDALAERLKKLDEPFKAAPADAGGNYDLPEPGTYQAVLREVDFFEMKNPPNSAFLKIIYEVVFDQKYQGRSIEMIYNLEPTGSRDDIEMKLGFLKRDLVKLGVDANADDFSLAMVRPGSSIWDGVLDTPVELAVKDSKKINDATGAPYRNAYLNQATGPPLPTGSTPMPPSDVTPAVGAGAIGDGDDIPFACSWA